jgi:eukaryotic-like serine/threonine-protein kinase
MTSIADVLGGRYRLVRLLGHGGMSDVYEAVDETDGRVVALKLVRSGDPEFSRRLAQEARALEGLTHPGLIALLDTGIADDQAYLVMEYVEGQTLAAALREGPLSPAATADLGARLAATLAYVHSRGVVHRDVKPSNILRTADGEAWLGDFGIAQLHDATTMTMAGTTLGTVSYMAPEQLEDHTVGPGADIWSLGIVLLECLTGKRAYEGSPSEVVARRLVAPVPIPADLPVAWRLVLIGMLDHDAERRLSGTDVATLLSTAAFDAPWKPSRKKAASSQPASPYDLTALMPGVVTAALIDPDATLATSGTTALAASGDATVVARGQLKSKPSTSHKRSTGGRRWWIKTGAVVALVALGIGLAVGLGHNPKKTPPTSTTHPTTTTTTTTTTLPNASNASNAIAALVSDMELGQAAGSIDPGSEQSIAQQAEQALADQSAHHLSQASNDLNQAAMTVSNGVNSAMITPAEGQTLIHDLTALASALGVTPPTTTTTAPGPPNGFGQGTTTGQAQPPSHGHGNGNG